MKTYDTIHDSQILDWDNEIKDELRNNEELQTKIIMTQTFLFDIVTVVSLQPNCNKEEEICNCSFSNFCQILLKQDSSLGKVNSFLQQMVDTSNTWYSRPHLAPNDGHQHEHFYIHHQQLKRDRCTFYVFYQC